MIVDAVFQLLSALELRTEGRGLLVLMGVLSLIVGLLLVRHPIEGVPAHCVKP